MATGMSTQSGETFVLIMVHYTWIAAVVLLCVPCAVAFLMRRKAHGAAGPEATTHDLEWRWYYAHPRWPFFVRSPWGTFVTLLGIIPLTMMLVCLTWGPILAAVEGWSVAVGVEHMVSNMLGLSYPLTPIIPDTTFGKLVDIIVSMWAMILFSTAMGVAACMSWVNLASLSMPSSACGLLRCMLVYIPFVLIVASLVTGGIMAAIEGWDFFDGFLYMAGVVCGLANPLVSNVVYSPWASFVEVLCIALELSLGGAIIGIIGAHPLTQRVVDLVESVHPEAGEHAAASNGKVVPLGEDEAAADAQYDGKEEPPKGDQVAALRAEVAKLKKELEEERNKWVLREAG